jgi:membrane-associated phospholipid phosphatase
MANDRAAKMSIHPWLSRASSAAGFMLALALLPKAARAAEPADLSAGWPAEWHRVGPAEAGSVAGLAVTAVALQLFLQAPDQPRWTQPILFDESARDALRAGSESGRSRASTISNGAYLLAAYPILVDAGFVAWLGRGKADAGLQLAVMDAEAIAITGIVTTTLQRAVGRARPFARDCATNPASSSECGSSSTDRNTSFVSGHAAVSFTAASMLCVQHSRLSIYGAGDGAVCPVALAGATTFSLLRVVADRHWTSDVIAGAVVGSTVGVAVAALHLRASEGAPTSGLTLGGQGQSMVYWRNF